MRYSALTLFFFLFTFWPLAAYSQSRDQNFPTRVTSNEISGVIPARDIGDARSTSYFYTFDGGQGDIFVNVVTKNLTGDIDIFTADSIQPLSKIVVYADSAQGETGRVIYLRRPARLLLRIEGRTPNDDPAMFKIKFAGSFVAMAPGEKEEAPIIDRTDRDDSSGVRVNSVGTIVAVPPKPKEPKVIEAEKEAVVAEAKDEASDIPRDVPVKRTTPAPEVKTVFGAKKKEKPTVDKTSATKEKSSAVSNSKDKPAADGVSASKEKSATVAVSPKKEKAEPVDAPSDLKRDIALPVETAPVDPLAIINLVIVMKDGGIIERPMSEVLRFSVDRGVLTVITKDRKTSRFSILNVEKVTIQ